MGLIALEVTLVILGLRFLAVLFLRFGLACLHILVFQHLVFVIVKTYKVEMKVLDTVIIQDVVLGLQQLTQVQVVEDSCLSQSEVLIAVIQGACVGVNALGSDALVQFIVVVTHVQ